MTGDDFIVASLTRDRVLSLGGNDKIVLGRGSDYADGGLGNDSVEGGSDNDTLLGADGDDELRGGPGNDRLIGGAGADRMIGNAGFDIVDYTNAANSVVLLLDATDSFGILGDYADLPAGGAAGEAAGDRVQEIEKVVATKFADKIYGAAWPWSVTVHLGAGDDQFDTKQETAHVDLVYGEAGNDVIFAGAGDDHLNGGEGDDDLVGEAGRDTLVGGPGSDTVFYPNSPSGVTIPLSKVDSFGIGGIRGTAGLRVGRGSDAEGDSYDGIENAVGSDFDDLIFGYDGGSVVELKAGNDVFDNNGILNIANDRVTGDDGDDRVFGGGGDDTLEGGGAGNDIISGEDGNDQMYGGIGNDQIYGWADDDLMFGQDGDDVLDGGRGNDSLFGEAGADVVIGGADSDYLMGGAGNDKFIFSLLGKGEVLGNDIIGDFQSNVDDIVLDRRLVSSFAVLDTKKNGSLGVGDAPFGKPVTIVTDDSGTPGLYITLLGGSITIEDLASLGSGDLVFPA